MSWLARLKDRNEPITAPTKTTESVFVVSVGPSPGDSPKIEAADIEAWIGRHHVLLHPDVTPATLAKFAGASTDLDRQIAEAGGVADPDCNCWPHSSALNTAEIEAFEARVVLFRRQGLDAAQADDLADKLVIRDREGDDRVCCAECRHAKTKDGTCPGGHPLPLQLVHRCIHVRTA